jgi:hypothetical protein
MLNLRFCCLQIDFISEAPEARQIIAHGETVGKRPQTNQTPAGVTEKTVRSFSAGPPGV